MVLSGDKEAELVTSNHVISLRERNLKLACLGSIPDLVAGEYYIADYILYRLNKALNFTYVEVLGLDCPYNNVRMMSADIVRGRGNIASEQSPLAGCRRFISLFRRGGFGQIMFDDIPSVEDIRSRRQQMMAGEPPGPWGPACFPGTGYESGLEM